MSIPFSVRISFTVKVVSFIIAAAISIPFSQTITGAAWAALNPGGIAGVEGSVRAFACSDTSIYIGGNFKIADNSYCNSIARWDGTRWSALGSGVTSSITALACVSSGNLYAGGSFSIAAGLPVIRIAKWNGQSWSNLGSGVSTGWLNQLLARFIVVVASNDENRSFVWCAEHILSAYWY